LWHFLKHFADFGLLSFSRVYNDGSLCVLQQVKITMQLTTCTQKDIVETTQVNSTNTSNMILFIIIAILIQNGIDLEYIEFMVDNASKME
jgi:hypothetical protein